MKELYTYNGFTGTKKQWSEHIGISYGSMINRFQKHFPDRQDKVFSEIYLTPGANMPNETCKEAKQRSDESMKKQYNYCKLLAVRKSLKQQLESVENQIVDNGFGR
ncbi:hypothetical protein ELBI_62 [Anabaena phage Elbi]|nr:hypothetical protein ELBI_62 [Anabaena phage Elbi]